MEKFVREGHENVRFFIGPEVEKTPAADKRTLFVVGLQDTETVERLAREWKTPHIFLSANRSFDSVAEVDGVLKVGDTLVSDWEAQIHYLLDRGFMVSLDYPAHKHELVLRALNAGIWQSRNFVPILSVAIPKVSTSSMNLTIKIDDSNFRATNDGVWCLNHHEVTDSNRFTSWDEYRDDMILSEDQITKTISPTFRPAAGPVILPVNVEPAVELVMPTEPVEDVKADLPKNDGSLGLDTESTTALKPDPETVSEHVVESPVNAAEAYAEGATTDPLGKDAPKKTKASKKAE